MVTESSVEIDGASKGLLPPGAELSPPGIVSPSGGPETSSEELEDSVAPEESSVNSEDSTGGVEVEDSSDDSVGVEDSVGGSMGGSTDV